jgi:predicted dehydrogenase
VHTLIVLNPGHFHAALTLRKHHPRLHDEVYVYGEGGPDLERFLALVRTFNERAEDPTHWRLKVYRGADYLERLCSERPGDVVIVAGRNDTKMASIHRLHEDGFHVLGDKPWLIHSGQIGMLQEVVASAPLAMDIMTERHELATRVQKALIEHAGVFGQFRTIADEPTIHMKSVHHLYKVVNGKPLVRPAWYFDVGAQGEGITDVTTHLADLAQWFAGRNTPFRYAWDVQLLSARQWPTAVPREKFARITGLKDFPDELQRNAADGTLSYLCNAELSYRLRGIGVKLESVWDLAIRDGAGDTHHAIVRGTQADLEVKQDPGTNFKTELIVRPVAGGTAFGHRLADTLASLQPVFPGLGLEPIGAAYRVTIPAALRTTHEEHFAAVLDQFLGDIDSGHRAANLGPELVCKYTLLARAAELSRAKP